MKGFVLDETGDVKIEHGRIQMVDENELLRQTCQSVLGTNKGEWVLNPDEGIDFHALRGKQVDYEAIRGELLEGLRQVDESFLLDSFEHELTADRKLRIRFSATCSSGTVTGDTRY